MFDDNEGFDDSLEYEEIEQLEQQQAKNPVETKPKVFSKQQQKSGSVEISGFNSKFVITGKKTQKRNTKVKSELETAIVPPPVAEVKTKSKESKKLPPPDPITIHQVDGVPIFDPENVKTWIYPTNYPLRDYQYSIVSTAILKNTLVCLPTGLGKTFIASVIMLNYYRWFPEGVIIFMAPTRPLVGQQIQACYQIVGIPQEDSIEMTGTIAPTTRAQYWQSKRVFFVTPQTLDRDIKRGTCPIHRVVCLVVDEAHRAQGNYSYCTTVKAISAVNKYFRILALSASPGSDVKHIQQVIDNLLIERMEVRTDDDPDVRKYIQHTDIETIVLPLSSQMIQVKNQFMNILREPLEKLVKSGAFFQSNPDRVSHGMLIAAREDWRKKFNGEQALQITIEGLYGLIIPLFQAWSLLNTHGLSSFANKLNTIHTEARTGKTSDGKNVSKMKRDFYLGNSEWNEMLTLASQYTNKGNNHPKLSKLQELLIEHFEDQDKDTRAIVFVQFRDSVSEILENLTKFQSIRATPFIGQSSGKSSGSSDSVKKGQTQKEQSQVLQRFRDGEFNTLIATSVGEEGLDIGQVDLIVCFDAQGSPIRWIQRLGRTGRKRQGRCVALLTAGTEENLYKRSLSKSSAVTKQLQKQEKFGFCYDVPRMFPDHVEDPEPVKEKLNIAEYQVPLENKKKRSRKKSEDHDEEEEKFEGKQEARDPENEQVFQDDFGDIQEITSDIDDNPVSFPKAFKKEDLDISSQSLSFSMEPSTADEISKRVASRLNAFAFRSNSTGTTPVKNKLEKIVDEVGFEDQEIQSGAIVYEPERYEEERVPSPVAMNFDDDDDGFILDSAPVVDSHPPPPARPLFQPQPKQAPVLQMEKNWKEMFPVLNKYLKFPVPASHSVPSIPVPPSLPKTSDLKNLQSISSQTSTTNTTTSNRYSQDMLISDSPFELKSLSSQSSQSLTTVSSSNSKPTVTQFVPTQNIVPQPIVQTIPKPVNIEPNQTVSSTNPAPSAPALTGFGGRIKFTLSPTKQPYSNPPSKGKDPVPLPAPSTATANTTTSTTTTATTTNTTTAASGVAPNYRKESYKNFMSRNNEPPNRGKKTVPMGAPNCLRNFNFLVTGVLDSLEREDAHKLIENYGGKVSKSFTKTVTHLLAGADSGPKKLSEAKERNIHVIDEDELFRMISESLSDKSPEKPEKAHHCPNCTETFVTEGLLTVHMQKQHPYRAYSDDDMDLLEQEEAPPPPKTKPKKVDKLVPMTSSTVTTVPQSATVSEPTKNTSSNTTKTTKPSTTTKTTKPSTTTTTTATNVGQSGSKTTKPNSIFAAFKKSSTPTPTPSLPTPKPTPAPFAFTPSSNPTPTPNTASTLQPEELSIPDPNNESFFLPSPIKAQPNLKRLKQKKENPHSVVGDAVYSISWIGEVVDYTDNCSYYEGCNVGKFSFCEGDMVEISVKKLHAKKRKDFEDFPKILGKITALYEQSDTHKYAKIQAFVFPEHTTEGRSGKYHQDEVLSVPEKEPHIEVPLESFIGPCVIQKANKFAKDESVNTPQYFYRKEFSLKKKVTTPLFSEEKRQKMVQNPKKKVKNSDVQYFIDDEAQVSTDSEDEDREQDEDDPSTNIYLIFTISCFIK